MTVCSVKIVMTPIIDERSLFRVRHVRGLWPIPNIRIPVLRYQRNLSVGKSGESFN